MNRPHLFDFKDYRAYLSQALEADKKARRGTQSQLSAHMGCQPAYLSAILKGSADLSLEQAASATEYFQHSSAEQHYFMLLVQKERAGTKLARQYFEAQISKVELERRSLARRLETNTKIAPEQQAMFYSNWYFMALHVALTVPHLQTRDALVSYFGLPADVVNKTLEFFISSGLAQQQGERFIVGPTQTFLEPSSYLAAPCHSQFRMRALTDIGFAKPESFRYSSTISASKKDLPQLKEIMMRAVEEIRRVVSDSPEEDVFCYTLDLFSLEN